MKTIPLTKGMVALVDDADYTFISQWKWYACCSHGNFYARRDVEVDGKKKRIYMHRVLSGAATGQSTDHKDRITLNNQRRNLRVGNQIQNMGNCGMQPHNTSGFKGVTFDKSRNKWVAQIKGENRSTTRIGRFRSATDAAIAYDEAAIRKYGEFALTNRLLGLL